MLVIKVELWPYGDSRQAETIATGVIANDGTGTVEVGRYDALFAHGDVCPDDMKDVLGVAIGARTTHRRRESVWRLVHKALHSWVTSD